MQSASFTPSTPPPLGMSLAGVAPDPCNLIVNYIPTPVNDEKLRELFAPFGTVVSARVIVDRFSSHPKGYGFVKYSTKEAAKEAIRAMNGFRIGNKHLRVTQANGPQNRFRSHGYPAAGMVDPALASLPPQFVQIIPSPQPQRPYAMMRPESDVANLPSPAQPVYQIILAPQQAGSQQPVPYLGFQHQFLTYDVNKQQVYGVPPPPFSSTTGATATGHPPSVSPTSVEEPTVFPAFPLNSNAFGCGPASHYTTSSSPGLSNATLSSSAFPAPQP